MAWVEHEKVAAGAIYRDSVDPQQRQLRVTTSRIHVRDRRDGKWKTWFEDGEDVYGPHGRSRHHGGNELGNDHIRKRVWVQKRTSGTWNDVSLTYAEAVDKVTSDPDLAVRRYNYTGPAGTLRAVLTTTPGTTKWTYRFIAAEAGRYRINVRCRPLVAVDSAVLTSLKSGEVVQCLWTFSDGRTARYRWEDMVADIASHNLDDTTKNLTVRCQGKLLAIGERLVLDPTLVVSGNDVGSGDNWGADIASGSRGDGDGGDWAGEAGLFTYWRVVNKFDLTSLSTETITQVDLRLYAQGGGDGSGTGGGRSGCSWEIGAYNGDADNDPDPETHTPISAVFSACDIVGNSWAYNTGLTDFRTNGEKNFTLGSADVNAVTHATAQRGDYFCVVVQQDNEASQGGYVDLGEYVDGTAAERPQLTVTYTTGGGAVPALDEGMLTGGMQPLGGGLE